MGLHDDKVYVQKWNNQANPCDFKDFPDWLIDDLHFNFVNDLKENLHEGSSSLINYMQF